MKKVLKKFNRTLSIMLAAAMVLTMVPQTAMPVLAAETQDVTDPSETPDTTPATDENEGSADVVEAKNPGNQEDSDTTEGENDESTEGETTPVIDEENNSDENQGQEGTPDVEEDPIEEEDTDSSDTAIMAAETPQAATLAPPVIILKRNGEIIESGTVIPINAADISLKYEFEAAEGTEGTPEIYYNVDEEADPTKESTRASGAYDLPFPAEPSTTTIKAIAYIPANGIEGEEGYVPAQTSTVATATIVFQNQATKKTISKMNVSDSATVTIDGQDIQTPYPITDTEKDIEVAVAANGKMFEVLYSVNGGTLTSALKKGHTDDKSYADRAVSYGNGTYIIPKEELTDSIEIKVSYLKEITFEWQGNATWDSVGAKSNVSRVDSDSEDEVGIWGWTTNYPAIEENKADVLFAPQDTKVEITFEAKVRDLKFANVSYAKAGATSEKMPGNIANDQKATVTIDNIENNDYIVTVEGSGAEAFPSSVRVFDAAEDNEIQGRNTYNVNAWHKYVIAAFDQYGKPWAIAPSDDLVKVANESAVKAESAEKLTYAETGLQYWASENYIYLPIGKGAAGKSIAVTIKATEGTKQLKTTLKAGPAVTNVTLKDTKLGNKVNQAPGTIRSYPLTITDAKAKDGLGVSVEEFKIDGKPSEGMTAENYFDASISGNSLNVVTERLAGVEKVEAALVIKNTSAEDVAAQAEVGRISLTIAKEDLENPTTKYAEKLTLKKTKAASNLYTGQEAVVATVDFGKDTYNRGTDVEIYDVPEGLWVIVGDRWYRPNAEGVVALADSKKVNELITLGDNLEIKLYAEQYMSVGKKTIKVRTTYLAGEGDENVVQTTASMPVTVVRGIENIEATSAPQIFRDGTGKQAKAGTAKITVAYNTEDAYNGDAKSAAPKTKKVTYEIGKYENGSFVKDDNVLGTTSKSKPMVTVKNGTVTVDKEYEPGTPKNDNKFAVRVAAADYEANFVDDIVEFTVSGDAAPLTGGSVVFVDNEEKKVDFDQVSGKNQFAVNRLKTLKAIVVKAGAEPDSNKQYAETDIVSKELYTMTPVKGNVVVNADGSITVSKLANNVEIVATANDGSKNNKASSGKFNVVYDKDTVLDNANVQYELKYDGNDKTGVLELEKDNTLDYPTGTVIHLNVTDAEGGKISGTSVFDLKLAVKNAKVVKKSADNLSLDILMTKSPVEVTLSDAKGTKATATTFKITNKCLDEGDKNDTDKKAYVKGLKDATPTVALAKGTKLYADVPGQTLSFTMNKTIPAAWKYEEGKDKKVARYVMISAQNTEEDTEKFLGTLEATKIKINPGVKEFTLTCKPGQKMPILKKGASVAFTFLDRDGEILTQSTKALTIKTTALKKSYKLDAKYTLSETDAASVALTDKRSAVKDVKFTELYNANVKGKVNRFKTGFELDKEHGTICLKTQKDGYGNITAIARDWNETNATTKAHKDDWIGFVECRVTYEDGMSDTVVSKIQVALAKTDKDKNITTAKKYTASAVNVLYNDSDMTGVTYISIGKLPAGVKAAYAVPDPAKCKVKGKEVANAFEVKMFEGVLGDEGRSMVDGNMITLSVKSPKECGDNKATYKGDLYIIPENSVYADQGSWTEEEMRNKGVKIANFTVNVKAPASNGKIKVTAKSVSFLNTEPEKLALGDGFGKYYYAEIPYTANMSADITTIDLENANKKNNKKVDADQDKQNNLVFEDITKESGAILKAVNVGNRNAIGLYIDAEKFQKELVIKDAKEWSGSVFSKIKVTVHFAGEHYDEARKKYDAAAPESFNISMTMPNPQDISKAEELLGKALQIIRDTVNDEVKVNGIKDVRYSAEDKVLTAIANDPDAEIAGAMTETTVDAIAQALLGDPELSSYVDVLEKINIEVSDSDNDKGTEITKKPGGEDANRQMLKDLINRYTDKLVKKLQSEGHDTPTWNDLDGRELKLTLTATPETGAPETESCTVKFSVNTTPDLDEGDEWDIAIANAVRRINSAAAIPGVGTVSYSVEGHRITIGVTDEKQDIVASKNAGRDSTVQILLGELGKYMNSVKEVKFSHTEDYVTDYVVVKREDHTATEAYISSLVDKWTDKLAKELAPNATYGRLIGKELTVTTDPDTENARTYVIVYE